MQSDIDLTSARDLSGTTIGRFAIQELLGKGGMGEVYRASDLRLKRQVALKRIAPHLRGDKRSRERLWKEAEWASRLSDLTSPQFTTSSRKRTNFSLSWSTGRQTLRRRIAEPISMLTSCLSLRSALPWRRHNVTCSPRHQAGEHHAEYIRQEGALDFGVAKNLPSRPETLTLSTRTCAEFVGTLAYMAPEVVLEKGSDSRADIFSLGLVFYEAIAGSNPFHTSSFLETSDRILHHDQPPLRELNPKSPPEFDRIVGKMLAKDPAQRYSTAADLR